MRDYWQDEAACLGMDAEIFYPESDEESARDEAKAICEACPVRQECQNYALSNREQFGVWGGMTELERRRVWRKSRPSNQPGYVKPGSVNGDS